MLFRSRLKSVILIINYIKKLLFDNFDGLTFIDEVSASQQRD